MIDSHCHLADEAFAGDLEAVVARARSAGLIGVLCVAEVTDPAEVNRLTGLCSQSRPNSSTVAFRQVLNKLTANKRGEDSDD